MIYQGLVNVPFWGFISHLKNQWRGVSSTNSYELRKISSNQQISTDIPSNINRYQQINLDIFGYFFTSPGNFSWFPPAARVVSGWPQKRFVRGFRWSPVASCAPVRFFFRPWHFFQKVRERRNSPNWAIFSKQLLIAVDWWTYLNWGEWRLYSISTVWLFDLSFFKQVERYHRYLICLWYSIERNSTIDIWYFYRNHYAYFYDISMPGRHGKTHLHWLHCSVNSQAAGSTLVGCTCHGAGLRLKTREGSRGKNPMGKIHGGKSRMDSWGKNLKNHWETLRTVGFLVDHLEWMDFMDLASGKLTKNELERSTMFNGFLSTISMGNFP